jgi:DNA-binding MarR family transcriptional regulator
MPRKRPSVPDAHVMTAMNALRRIVRSLRLAAGDVERELGVSVAQLFVLKQLADGRPRSMRELADEAMTDPSTVSGVVRRLVEGKLVKREVSDADARRAAVMLTREGAALIARAPKAPQDELLAALAEMPAARRRALGDGLQALADRVGPAPPSLFFEDEAPAKRRR